MVNVGEQPVPMNVFLSYGERDKLRNQRHTTTTDAPNGLGADEYPLLSLYVMKSTVPDRRYVGGALPLVHASARYDASSMPDRRYLGYLGVALPLVHASAHHDAPIHFPTGTWACSPPMSRSMSRTRSSRMRGASRLGGPSLPAACTRYLQSWTKAPTTRCTARYDASDDNSWTTHWPLSDH